MLSIYPKCINTVCTSIQLVSQKLNNGKTYPLTNEYINNVNTPIESVHVCNNTLFLYLFCNINSNEYSWLIIQFMVYIKNVVHSDDIRSRFIDLFTNHVVLSLICLRITLCYHWYFWYWHSKPYVSKARQLLQLTDVYIAPILEKNKNIQKQSSI